jgi:hypothetical protein
MTATRMNIVKVLENASIAIEMTRLKREGRITFSLE